LIVALQENHRALAELPLKAVGIELGLLLTDPGIASRALGFHEAERLRQAIPDRQ